MSNLVAYLLEETPDELDPSDLIAGGTMEGTLRKFGLEPTETSTYEKRPMVTYVGQEIEPVTCFYSKYTGLRIKLKNLIPADPHGPLPRDPFNFVDIEVGTWFTPEWGEYHARVEVKYGNSSLYPSNHYGSRSEFDEAQYAKRRLERMIRVLRAHHPKTFNGLRKVIRLGFHGPAR